MLIPFRWTAVSVAGVTISLLCIVILVIQVDVAEVFLNLRLASLPWIVAGIAVHGLRVVALVARWWILLRSIGVLSIRTAAESLVVSYAINAIAPARLGDVARVVDVSRRHGVSVGTVSAVIVLERVWDGAVLVVLTAIAIAVTGVYQSVVDLLTRVSLGDERLHSVLLVISGVTLVVFCAWWMAHSSMRGHVLEWLRDIRRGWIVASHPRTSTFALGLTMLTWIAECFVYYCGMQSVGVELSWRVLFLVGTVGSLSVMIPASPGSVGTFEAVVVGVLVGFGISAANGLAAAVIIHVLVLLPVALVGMLGVPASLSRVLRRRFSEEGSDLRARG